MKVVKLRKNGSKSVGSDFSKVESKTRQEFKKECDVNNIMSQFSKTKVFTHLNPRQGVYGDFSDMTQASLLDAVNIVETAVSAFSGLPAVIRDRFKNSPHEFLSWINDPANVDEAVSLGLRSRPDTGPDAKPPAGDKPKARQKAPKEEPVSEPDGE